MSVGDRSMLHANCWIPMTAATTAEFRARLSTTCARAVAPTGHHQLVNMKDWLRDLEREIERRVDAAIQRGSCTRADENLEPRTAPSVVDALFSTRGRLAYGGVSLGRGWLEPA